MACSSGELHAISFLKAHVFYVLLCPCQAHLCKPFYSKLSLFDYQLYICLALLSLLPYS